jgi:AraC-like DNA-binding protein
MTIRQKNGLLTRHSFFNLGLTHAVIGSYPCHVKKHSMTVNRLLMIFDDSGLEDSLIRDSSSGELFPMRTGFLYFIPCNHEIDADLTENLFFVSLHFNLDLFYGFDVFNNYQHCIMIKNPELVYEAKQLLEREDEIKTLCRINEIIFNLCVSLLPDRQAETQKKLVDWRKHERILNFVKKSGDAATTVAMLADMAGMRQDVFSRKFTRDMNITPKDFITNTLMRKASEMLLASDINIRTVAENLNFSSEYYFSRFFKKHTGMAPKLFRKLNGNG